MSSHGISFGTDGWRAIIADIFTVDRVQIVAQAVADWLVSEGKSGSKVLIGYDGRFGGEMFSMAAGRVLQGNGFKVAVTKAAIPTPALSWQIPVGGYEAGLMLSASHNPPAYNGIKIKPHYGGSPGDEVILPIVERLGKTSPPRLGEAGAIERVDFISGYLDKVRDMVDIPALKKLAGKVVFDPMGGAQVGHLAKVLKGVPLEVVEIHNRLDPMFCGLTAPEPVESNLKDLKAAVKAEKPVLGIANDGDGDRVAIVDENGRALTAHELFAVLLLFMIRQRKQTGGIIKTVSGTFLIDRIARKYGLDVEESPVGFKYICKAMRERDILIGGEESGGIGFKGYIPERDGLLAGLLFLELLAKSGKKASELVKEMHDEFGESYYARTDFHDFGAQETLKKMKAAPPVSVDGEKVASINPKDGIKIILEDGSWLLFRASGTEPLLRIYSEATTAAKVKRLLEAGAALAGTHK